MDDVFISYKKERKLTAERLAAILAANGYTVWWDNDLAPGDDFRRAIETKIGEVKAVIVLWCESAVASKFVLDEATAGLSDDRLLPVLIADVQPPMGFRQTQTESLVGWTGDPEAAPMTRLINAVARKVGRAPRRDETLWKQLIALPPLEQATAGGARRIVEARAKKNGATARIAAFAAVILVLAIGAAAYAFRSSWLPPPPAVAAATPEPAPSSPPATAAPVQVTQITIDPGVHQLRPCGSCPEMMVIPAGAFEMGSPASDPDARPDELPAHTVNVARFAIALNEVTGGDWAACVRDKACPAIPGTRDDPLLPINQVSWTDANRYVAWLNKQDPSSGWTFRLPSEAEWEYAARAKKSEPAGPDTAVFSPERAVHDAATKHNAAMPVRSLKANWFGLYDMLGNVYEWVADCYAPYPSGPAASATPEPAACPMRIVRGGSYDCATVSVRIANRVKMRPDGQTYDIGFRVAATPPAEAGQN